MKRKVTSIVNQLLGKANPFLDHELTPTTRTRGEDQYEKKSRRFKKIKDFSLQDKKTPFLFFFSPLLLQMQLTMSSVVYRIVQYGGDKCDL